MAKYARKKHKKAVARYATPSKVVALNPASPGLATLENAKDVLNKRYGGDVTWRIISWELGGINRGTLFNVAKNGRVPSLELIRAINRVYKCHLQPATKVAITPLACGHAPLRKNCPTCNPPKKYAPHPVMRLTELERRMVRILGLLVGETPSSVIES